MRRSLAPRPGRTRVPPHRDTAPSPTPRRRHGAPLRREQSASRAPGCRPPRSGKTTGAAVPAVPRRCIVPFNRRGRMPRDQPDAAVRQRGRAQRSATQRHALHGRSRGEVTPAAQCPAWRIGRVCWQSASCGAFPSAPRPLPASPRAVAETVSTAPRCRSNSTADARRRRAIAPPT